MSFQTFFLISRLLLKFCFLKILFGLVSSSTCEICKNRRSESDSANSKQSEESKYMAGSVISQNVSCAGSLHRHSYFGL
uniref:Secreted protein n=1 Tax=Electrophorus electricus TaxID=8005 RepID=A0AAY5E7Q9_ELEEL